MMFLYKFLFFISLTASPIFANMAPFTPEDVIAHASAEKKDSLKNQEAKKKINQVIFALNNNRWPERYGFKESYDKANPNDDHNKTLIADYVFRDLQKESLSQQVVQGLQSKGKIGPDPTIKTKTIKGSVYTDHLIFIKDKNSCPMVAKVFRNLEDFLLENKQLKEEDAYIGTVNELKTSCDYPLPIITRRLGKIELEGVGVILLEKAKGKTLKDIYMNLESMQDSKIKEIYHTIGAQFGELDSLMYANKHQILFHSDGHHGNFLYDEKDKQLYWIDTAGIKFVEDYSEIPNLKLFSQNLNNASQSLSIKQKLQEALTKFQDEIEKNLTLQPQLEKDIMRLRMGTIEQNPSILKILQSLPENDKKLFLELLQSVISLFKKQLLALQSFGEGYCEKNHRAKNVFNKYLELKENVLDRGKTLNYYIILINKFEEVLDHPKTQFEIEIK